MKLISVVAFVLLLAGASSAQEARAARVVAELAASADGVVKNSPFSADAVSESVQVLTDGNRITRTATTKLYRNSEGRFRREMQGGTGGVLGSAFSVGQGVTIVDPVAGRQYMLDRELKMARAAELKGLPGISIVRAPDQERRSVAAGEALRAAELKATQDNIRRRETNSQLVEETAVAAGALPRANLVGAYNVGANHETRMEQLGSQIIEGVEAEGTRRYTTIPAGAIGNEKPIEIVYERWYSNDLQMTVYSKHVDPRFGEHTYRLTNIIRSEPDPALFSVPQGYKISAEPGAVYRLRTPEGEAGQITVVRTTKSSEAPEKP